MANRREIRTIKAKRGTQRYENERSGGSSSSKKKNIDYNSPEHKISNAKTRLKGSGYHGYKNKKQVHRDNSGENSLKKVVDKALYIADRPHDAVMVGLKHAFKEKQAGGDLGDILSSGLSGAKRGFKGKEDYSGAQLLMDNGVKNKTALFLGGLGLDMSLDPVSYLTTGLGSFAKGVATGSKAVKTTDVIEDVLKLNKFRDVKAAESSMNAYVNASSKASALKRLNLTSDQYDIAAKRLAYSRKTGLDAKANLADLESAYKSAVTKADEAARVMKQGKGLSFAGKTIVSADKMQDAGARVGQLLGKVPGVNATRDTVGAMFDATRVGRASKEASEMYRRTVNAGKGMRNQLNSDTQHKAQALAEILKGSKLNGRALDDEISDIIATGGQGVTQDVLDTVVATTAKKRAAAKRLGINERATIGDIVNFYNKDYQKIGRQELNMGLLGGMKSNYMPRVLNETGVRGGKFRNFNINNPFGYKSNDAFNNRAISEINADMRKQYGADDAFKFFEESSVKAYATRMLSHNKVLADKQVVDELIASVGKQVTDYKQMNNLLNNGYDIVIPKEYLKVFDAGGMGDVIKGKAATEWAKEAGKELQLPTGEVFLTLDEKTAKALVATRENSKYMIAMPQGIASEYNKLGKAQVDASKIALLNVVDSFNKVWKPLVTSMNINFHRRNLMSASFNNFIEVGMEMFNPATQRAALSVMGHGGGLVDNAAITIGKNKYTAKELYNLMVRNNAISTYGMSEADNLTKGIMGDISRTVKGNNPYTAIEQFGRKAGNRVEEYVRANCFVACMKKGLNPEDAAEIVRKVQFDYSDLTALERELKTVFPFYTWFRKNFPLQVESLLNNPSPYLLADRAARTGAEVTGMGDYENLPDYIQESRAIPYGVTYDEDGNVDRYKVADLGLPISDLSVGARDLAGMLSPLVKAPIELLTNQQILTGYNLYGNKYDDGEMEAAIKLTKTGEMPIDKLIQSSPQLSKYLVDNPKAAKYLDYAINNSGFLTNVNKYGATEDTSGKVMQAPYNRYPDKYEGAEKIADLLYKGDSKKERAKNRDAVESVSAIMNMLRGAVDPSATKYFSKSKALKQQNYEYLDYLTQLINDKNALNEADPKKYGRVYTLNELRKQGIIN